MPPPLAVTSLKVTDNVNMAVERDGKKRPPNGSRHGHHGGRARDDFFFFMLYLKPIKATQMEW